MAVIYNSHPYGLLDYTSPSNKLTRKSDGLFRFGAHNLYLNSAAPANQAITVISGATYSVTITGTVSVTASGAATGTWTAGTTTFTAATATLTLGSTSGAGTVHVRRTPSESLYLATAGVARYAMPFAWTTAGVLNGLVREQAATNLVLRSTDASHASWTKSRMTTGGTTTGAIADIPAIGVFETVDNNSHRIFQAITIVAGSTLTGSAILKANGRKIYRLIVASDGEANGFRGFFDLDAGTKGTLDKVGTAVAVSSSITPLANGFYLCSITGTVDPGATAPGFFISSHLDDGTSSFVGDVTKGYYCNHAQIETGAYASSPIITYGAAGLRVADTITEDIASFMSGATEYGMYLSFKRNSLTSSAFPVTLSVDTSTFTTRAGFYMALGLTENIMARQGGVDTALLSSGLTSVAGSTVRIAGSYKVNDFRVSANGGAVQSDVSGALPSPLAFLYMGLNGGFDIIEKIIIYKRALTDAELLSLSTNGVLS